MVKEVNYTEAFKRPFEDIRKLIIGCLLNIIPIIGFFATGYTMKAGEITLKNKKDLPEWTDWGRLFVDGLLAFVIGVVWFLPAIILIVIGAIGVGATALLSGGALTATDVLATLGLPVIIALVLGLIAMYFVPLAVMGYVSTRKIGEAFKIGTILRKGLKGKYFIVWLVSFVVGMVLSLIASMTYVLSIILSPAASFISMIIGITLVASIYKEL